MNPGAVHLVSLGCPKNRVDSEVMLGHMLADGWAVTDEPSDAEVIVVNTCGFLQAALEESVDTILEMAAYKDEGRCERLVVTGCAAVRHADEMAKEIPEVDHFLGVATFSKLPQVLRDDTGPGRRLDVGPTAAFLYDHMTPRVNSTPGRSAYVKISEGCDNRCTFCIIPQLRGPQRSRPVADVVAEARSLAETGVREINLIAQDLTAYGYDQGGRGGPRLHTLVRGLAAVSDLRWIRLLYAYPRKFPDALIDAIAEEERVCNYLDMPLQHISDPVLRRMRRGHRADKARALLARLRERVPDIAIRTTFIVGFPGETDEDFEALLEFVRDQRFERVGVFRFSVEPGTPAAELPRQVPTRIRAERWKALMEAQAIISRERNDELVGRHVEVLVEGRSAQTDLLLQGRMATQAPDIDGVVYINEGEASPGDFVTVRIEESHDYDLVGPIVG